MERNVKVAEKEAEQIGRVAGWEALDNEKEFKALKAEAQGFSNHIAMRFSFMAQKIKANLTTDEQKILHNLLQGDTKIKVAPSKLQELSKDARKLITEVAQEYVDAGLITRETFAKNKNIKTFLNKTIQVSDDEPPLFYDNYDPEALSEIIK